MRFVLYLNVIVLFRLTYGDENPSTSLKIAPRIVDRTRLHDRSTLSPQVSSPGITEIRECPFDTIAKRNLNNGTEHASCCSDVVNYFRKNWMKVLTNLSDFLRMLRTANCPQFEVECSERLYAFTEFNTLTYDRFCNETNFLIQCQDQLTDIMLKFKENSSHKTNNAGVYAINRNEGSNTTHEDRKMENSTRLLIDIQQEDLELEDILEPCVQVSQINLHTQPAEGYFEMKDTTVPGCGIVWCGFSGSAIEKFEISEWSCTPTRCKANIIIIMVACGILAVASTLVNAIAVIVFINNRRLRDSQGIYKMSLATADLLVGLFVFPTTIETLRRAYMPITTTQYEEENGSIVRSLQIASFSGHYLNFVGFFITLPTSVSVYTLMVASFDRFMVVFRPLRYNLYTAKHWASKFSVVVWIVGIIFSLLPIVLPSIQYQFVGGFLASFTGDGDFIILSIAFVIPIIFVIISHIATFAFSKKNAKARPKTIPCEGMVRPANVENRLAKTLSIMVATFLGCILPLGAVVTSHLILHEINPRNPETLNVETMTLISLLELIFCVVFMSNSLWNFFIYNARSAEFRNACKRLSTVTKVQLRSKLFRDSAKEARQRRTSAAVSNTSSQAHCTTSSTANV